MTTLLSHPYLPAARLAYLHERNLKIKFENMFIRYYVIFSKEIDEQYISEN